MDSQARGRYPVKPYIGIYGVHLYCAPQLRKYKFPTEIRYGWERTVEIRYDGRGYFCSHYIGHSRQPLLCNTFIFKQNGHFWSAHLEFSMPKYEFQCPVGLFWQRVLLDKRWKRDGLLLVTGRRDSLDPRDREFSCGI